MILKIFKLFLFFSLVSLKLNCQTVFEPIDSEIYEFLSDQAAKGIIEFNDNIKPVSRLYIADLLFNLSRKTNFLTSIEKQELQFFMIDYGLEINKIKKDYIQPNISIFKKNSFNRFSVFDYSDSLFSIKVDPILGYVYQRINSKINKHFFNGINIFGYIGNNIGYNFYFRDNHESGDYLDTVREFTQERGITLAKRGADFFEYSDTRGSLVYNWSWGNAEIAKDYITIGNSITGSVILSDKAPSFPYFGIEINPTSWLSFKYLHAWLSSDIVDSTNGYQTLRAGIQRYSYRPKYMALHSLTLMPSKGLKLTLGESIIYSEHLEFIYFIPVVFFRLADHYNSNYNNGQGGNAQIFFTISAHNILPNTNLYSSLFIDDISVSDLFNQSKQRNKIGYTLGGKYVNLFISDLKLEIEFTRILPYVYTHSIQTLTYENTSYLLGNWIGQNADIIHLGLDYKFLRGLKIKSYFEYLRKGTLGNIEDGQKAPLPDFLFGLRKNFTTYGIELNYEFMHRLNAKLKYEYGDHEVETTSNIYSNNKFNEFSFSLYYGM